MAAVPIIKSNNSRPSIDDSTNFYTKIGQGIEQSSALHKFDLDFRHVALYRTLEKPKGE